MTAAVVVPHEAGPIQQEWLRLAAGTAHPPRFDPAMIADLPEPARRWLIHAITPGTPLWQTVELTMHGQIRLGQWRSFTARQIIAMPHGYIWAAAARVAGLPVAGFDRLSSGTAQMRWRLLHLVPVMTAAGPDVTRSACGRLAGEIALIPTAFQQALWAQGEHPSTAIATWKFGQDTEAAALRTGDGGLLWRLWSTDGATPAARPSAAARSGCRWRRSRSSAASPFPQGSGPDGGGAPSGRTRVSSSAPASLTP